MTAPAMEKLRTLPGFRRAGKGWEARCPGHEDRRASLSISLGDDGRVLLHCHAGCETAAVLAKLGLEERDLFNGNGQAAPEKRIVATYPYQDAQGRLLFEVVRFEPKSFRQRRPDGNGGWIWNLENTPRVLYRLPEILAASDVFIVEGEKDVESLRKIGLTATCNPGGAGKWRLEYNEWLRGKHVVIIPDKDDPGRRHAHEIARSLYGGIAASVKLLELPGDGKDISDWLEGRDPVEAAEELCRLAEAAPGWRRNAPPAHRFENDSGERYRLILPELQSVLEVDRLRRESHELIGELCVRCELPGARTYDGVLSVADFNLSSARARTERAKLLAARSLTEDADWPGFLEELCQRVLAAERTGQPAIDLRQVPLPGPDDDLLLEGLRLPRRHPVILFGDGGACKSYLALYMAGRMSQNGLRVALFDWELAAEDHRVRLRRMFGAVEPLVFYARCERPLVHEADRLRRIVRDEKIDYAIYDSVAYACDGPPEAAEVAGRYFRAVRQIGVGSLHIAHITKAEGGDQKPFGTVFWYNSARACWFMKLAEASADESHLEIGLFPRKFNLGRRDKPTGFTVRFEADRTTFDRSEPAEVPELAEKMTIRERMQHILRRGAVSVPELAQELDVKPDTITRTVRRHRTSFTVIEGGKVALLQRVI